MAKPPKEALTRIEIDHLQTLKARWDEAHAAGMAALKRGDHRAAAEALRVQRDIIEQQRTLLLFRLGRVKSERRAEQPGSVTDLRESIGIRPRRQPPLLGEQVAWTLTKHDQVVRVALRRYPHGTELRCLHQGAVLWTEWFPLGHDPATLRLAIEDTKAAWQAKGFTNA